MNVDNPNTVKSNYSILKQTELLSALVDYAKAEKVLKNVDEQFKKFTSNCENIEKANQRESFYKSNVKYQTSEEKRRIKCLVDKSISRIKDELATELKENKRNINSKRNINNIKRFKNRSIKTPSEDNIRNLHVNKSLSSIKLKQKTSYSTIKENPSYQTLKSKIEEKNVKKYINNNKEKINNPYISPRSEINIAQQGINQQLFTYQMNNQTYNQSLNNRQSYNNQQLNNLSYEQSFQNHLINYPKDVQDQFIKHDQPTTQSLNNYQPSNHHSTTKFIKGVNGKLIPLIPNIQYPMPNLTSKQPSLNQINPLPQSNPQSVISIIII